MPINVAPGGLLPGAPYALQSGESLTPGADGIATLTASTDGGTTWTAQPLYNDTLTYATEITIPAANFQLASGQLLLSPEVGIPDTLAPQTLQADIAYPVTDGGGFYQARHTQVLFTVLAPGSTGGGTSDSPPVPEYVFLTVSGG